MQSSLVSVYLHLKYIFEPQQRTNTLKTSSQLKPQHITDAFKCQTTCYAFQRTSTSNCIYMLHSTSVLKRQQTHSIFCMLVSEYAVGVERGVCVIALSWKHMLSLLVINVQLVELDVEPRAKRLSWEWTIKSRAGTCCSATGFLNTELKNMSEWWTATVFQLVSVCVSSTPSL